MSYKEWENGNKRVFKTILVWVILVSMWGATTAYCAVGPSFTYKSEVHSHMENAYYANTPELMIAELNESINGMRNLDLDRGMYSKIMPWEHTADRQMAYQYRHLTSIKERAEAVIVWRDGIYNNLSCQAESLGDVYEEKMDNLRGFLQEEGWSDWIAEEAYFVNHHTPLYSLGIFYIWFAIALAIWSIILLPIITLMKDDLY